MDELDPNEAERLLTKWSGEILGRFALGDETVTHGDLYQAAAISWIGIQDTPEGVFNPHNHRIVDLFVTP